MSPVTNKAATNLLQVDTDKRTNVNDDETDEGFVSPSVQRIGLLKNGHNKESEANVSSGSDNDSQTESCSSSSSPSDGGRGSKSSSNSNNSSSASQAAIIHSSSSSDDDEIEVDPEKRDEEEETTKGEATNKVVTTNKDKDAAADSKAENLAKFIVNTLLGKDNGNTSDRVERTLLRCVKMMMQKHEILFKGMMRRLQVTRETGYVAFVTVANTLFEDDKKVITWSRIVALYAFGGQLALYCKDNNMEDFTNTVAGFMGKYAKEVLTPHITSNLGGWEKICDEFPDESDIENKIRRVLSWTAVGLGVAATVSYLTSR